MLKLFIFFALIFTHVLSDDKVEVYATTINTKNNILTADGEVIVIYQDYHLTAQKAIYDRNNGELELFGNIRANQADNTRVLGEYAKLNIAKKERAFKPFYMLEKKADIWISGEQSFTKDSKIDIKSGVVSGCNPINPLWKMEFSSSDYDSEEKWLNLYNARIYIYDIPVFYAPYIGYSLDDSRRTGVLPPLFGFSEKEGFYYEQALYIAEKNWWDLELRPQIRTNRGEGIYSSFRFVDSKVSKGIFSTGFFKEKEEYYLRNRLANQKHYGFDFLYHNSDVINEWFGSNLKGQSGLYIDIKDMNDVDYINLSKNDTTKNNTARQLISRVNLFYNTDDHYFGAYMKYYKDLTSDNNKRTLQNLPSIHYHSYLDTLIDNHLLYSFDIKSNNYYREVGKTAVQTDINVPVTLQTSLFDEYMTLSYKANLHAQHTSFNGEEEVPTSTEYNNGLYARNHHSITASSQLTRAFDNITHVIDFGSKYVVGGSEMKNGYYDEQKDFCSETINRSNPVCQFYRVTDMRENLQLYFSQYLYDITGKQMLYHRLAQIISYETANNGSAELENELDYQISDKINFYNNMFYNYDRSTFSKNFNRISYRDKDLDFGLSHMYKNGFIDTTQNTSYLTSFVNYRYSKNYAYTFKYDIDLETSEKKSSEIGFIYKKKCWDFGLRYVENRRPILNRTGIANSIFDRFIYITIRLKPIMPESSKASGFVYRMPGDR